MPIEIQSLNYRLHILVWVTDTSEVARIITIKQQYFNDISTIYKTIDTIIWVQQYLCALLRMKITSKIMSTQINIRILSNLVNQVKDFIVYSDYNVISSWALSLASACKIHYKHVPSIKHYKIKSVTLNKPDSKTTKWIFIWFSPLQGP